MIKRDPAKDADVIDLINFIKDELRCREATYLVNNSSCKVKRENIISYHMNEILNL